MHKPQTGLVAIFRVADFVDVPDRPQSWVRGTGSPGRLDIHRAALREVWVWRSSSPRLREGVVGRWQVEPDHFGDLDGQFRLGRGRKDIVLPRRDPEFVPCLALTTVSWIPRRCEQTRELEGPSNFFGGGARVEGTVIQESILRGQPAQSTSTDPSTSTWSWRTGQASTVVPAAPTFSAPVL